MQGFFSKCEPKHKQRLLNLSKKSATVKKRLSKLDICYLITFLTGFPALTGPLCTEGGLRILTKLGQGGQYLTPRYPNLKKTLLDPRGGLLGHLKFLLRGKSTADLSHDWAWIKNFLGWPEGGPKAFPKLHQKFLDPALFWSSRPLGSFLAPLFGMSPWGFPT